MKQVLDSCVALKWIFAETGSDKALKLRDDFLNLLTEFIAPDVFPIEVAHAITRAQRANRITTKEGERSMKTILTLLPDLRDSLSFLPRAYEISTQFRIGVYDCLYVALCEREGCELVTADQRLVTNLGQRFPIISLDSL